eukprot:TRINITY_DN25829_c0_g1_i3.p1 TRINITY_DN25829_c0_g1~~TRINITY_DN25829_c0_g1_i3.p1  ORF type:complete len:372 (+),score=53.44 TRINITY_DN25829_c0_g1_i3:128-1243(+)
MQAMRLVGAALTIDRLATAWAQTSLEQQAAAVGSSVIHIDATPDMSREEFLAVIQKVERLCFGGWHYYEYCCCTEESADSRSCWTQGYSPAICCTWERGPDLRCLPDPRGYIFIGVSGAMQRAAKIYQQPGKADDKGCKLLNDWPGRFLAETDFMRSMLRFKGRRLRVLDAGAGLGLTSIVTASFGAKVVAFDVADCEMKYLRMNVHANSVEDNVQVAQLDLAEWRSWLSSLEAWNDGRKFDVILAWGMNYLPLERFQDLLDVVDRVGAPDMVWPYQCTMDPEDLTDVQSERRKLAMARFESVANIRFRNFGHSALRWNKLGLDKLCFLQRPNRARTWRYRDFRRRCRDMPSNSTGAVDAECDFGVYGSRV